MIVKDITNPALFHNVEIQRRHYASASNAVEAAQREIAPYEMDAVATVLPVQRKDGRFVPILVFQGREATHAAALGAQRGFLSIA